MNVSRRDRRRLQGDRARSAARSASARTRGRSASAPTARRSTSTTPSISPSPSTTADMQQLGDDQGLRAAEDAGVGARQGAVQHRQLPPMTSRRWIACSSCHPDGRTTAASGSNPEGLRKTTAAVRPGPHASAALVGRPRRGAGLRVHDPQPADAGRRPGHGRDEAARSASTRSSWRRRLSGRSKDLDALAIYTNSFEFPLSPHIAGAGQAVAGGRARQGALLRARKSAAPPATAARTTPTARCRSRSSCTTSAPAATTRREKMGPKYDTPTLLGVYRTAPYLHHGKAKTLHDVLTTQQQGRQARQDEPPEAGRDRRPGGVPEVAALRDAAGRDAEHGEVSALPKPKQGRARQIAAVARS